jgi:hypothetical protein
MVQENLFIIRYPNEIDFLLDFGTIARELSLLLSSIFLESFRLRIVFLSEFPGRLRRRSNSIRPEFRTVDREFPKLEYFLQSEDLFEYQYITIQIQIFLSNRKRCQMVEYEMKTGMCQVTVKSLNKRRNKMFCGLINEIKTETEFSFTTEIQNKT